MTSSSYLPLGLPAPQPESDGVSAPYWDGLRQGRLLVQHCLECGTWQFAPEWICHACHAADPPFQEVMARGEIFSWERVWHASHPALVSRVPYLVVLVRLPQAGDVRMIGNLLGDPLQEPRIGTAVSGVFEPHQEASPPYALLQWQVSA
jgi:uncharacterized OB-fold protein